MPISQVKLWRILSYLFIFALPKPWIRLARRPAHPCMYLWLCHTQESTGLRPLFFTLTFLRIHTPLVRDMEQNAGAVDTEREYLLDGAMPNPRPVWPG